MEIIPVVSPSNFHLLGYESREQVVSNKLWHFSSLVIPIQEGTGKVLIQVRPKGKTYEGKLDIFGGYVHKSKYTDQLMDKFDHSILEKVFLETAVRESNEEIKIEMDKYNKLLNSDDLSLLDPFLGYIADNDVIKEISSAYVLQIWYLLMMM